jgi:hypothetical protein
MSYVNFSGKVKEIFLEMQLKRDKKGISKKLYIK